jgi:hypothetical protein
LPGNKIFKALNLSAHDTPGIRFSLFSFYF